MNLRVPPSLSLAVLCACVPLPGQASWTPLFDGGAGLPVTPGPATVYDASRDRIVVLHGGSCSMSGPETWEFDGSRWRQLFPSVSPPIRTSTAMVYDAHRKRAIIFSGETGLNDLWEWDGTNWTERVTGVRPPAGFGHMMAYDELRRCVVLFGGVDGFGRFDDTWTWDGATWEERMPATRPQGRAGAGMAYDPVRGRVVMFGGVASSPSIELNDTWEWDGTDWTEIQTGIERPFVRSSPGLAYDPQRRMTILFGGFGGSFGFGFADTWGFDGQRWTPLLAPGAGPLGRAAPGMVYDSRRGRVLVYGGSTFPMTGRQCFLDFWVLNNPTPGFNGFGTGCPGEAGAPLLSLASKQVPRGGGRLRLRLSQLSTAPTTTALFAFGASRQQWAGLSLPTPLPGLGSSTCSLWVGLDVVVPSTPQAGIAELSLRVPGSVTLHVQGLAIDPTGLSLSGAATIDTTP